LESGSRSFSYILKPETSFNTVHVYALKMRLFWLRENVVAKHATSWDNRSLYARPNKTAPAIIYTRRS